MTEDTFGTILELAEVIAAQNAEIRELTIQLEEQQDTLIDYELNDEEEEKVTAAFACDFQDLINSASEEEAKAFQELFDQYFSAVMV